MRKTNRHLHRKVLSTVACVLILPFILSGCMPYKELKEESIVEGVGIDFGANGYDLTFQIYNPEQNSGSGSKKSGSSTVTILQSNGTTINDAVRNATLQIGRKLYFSNVRAYVVGEEVCSEKFTKILDFLERNHEIKPNEQIFVAKGKAADIMTYKKDDEIVPAVNLELMAQNYAQTSKMVNVVILDIFKNVATGITDPMISAISLKKNDSGKEIIEMDGAAVFHNNSIAGYLDKTQTRGCLWIAGKATGGIVTLNLPQGGLASIEILGSSSKITLSANGEKPVAKVEITVNSSLTEIQSKSSYTIDSNFITGLEKLQNEAVTAEARNAVNQALKTYSSDVFGFGLKIFEDKPELWRKIGKDWEANDKNIRVDITTKSSINQTGLTAQTVFAKKSTMRS